MIPLAILLAALLAASALGASKESRPTFHKDVEPILQTRCQGCHRPGEIGPLSLLSYQDVRPWAKAIRSAVATGKMPPWSPDPHYGKFTNDLSLTSTEKDKIIAWVDAGAPEGKTSEAPPAKKFAAEGWHIGKPDVVFEMPEAFDVPAKGAIDYQYIHVPTNFTEDKWVQMVEVIPGDRSVVHHAIVMVKGMAMRPDEYLGGYAPGMMPQIWKPNQARFVRAGATLEFQMHYSTTGKPGRDKTRVGLIFAKEPIKEQIVALQSMPRDLKIPPMLDNYRVDGLFVMPREAKLVAMRAHLHVRGKSFQFRAVYPDGTTEILLDIPKYDFNWQPYYYLETPKVLPRGTRIETTAYYDNSPNNPFNPDPSATILWGPQTWDEMMIGWFDVAVERPATRGVSTVAPGAGPAVNRP
jgi:hypothetical protein